MSVREELEAASAKYLEALARGDIDEVGEFFSEDAIRVVSGRPIVKGRQAIKNHLKEVIGAGVSATLEFKEVREFGDLALEVGTFQAGDRSGKFMGLAQRRSDGSWQILGQSLALD